VERKRFTGLLLEPYPGNDYRLRRGHFLKGLTQYLEAA